MQTDSSQEFQCTPVFQVFCNNFHCLLSLLVTCVTYFFCLLKGSIMNHPVRAQDTQKVTDSLVNWIVWRGLTALKAASQIYQISAGNFI